MKSVNNITVILVLWLLGSAKLCLAHDSTFVKVTATDTLLLYGSPFLTAEGFTSFHTAIDSANSQGRTLVVSREVSLSTQDTIRSNLIIRQGGLISGHNLIVEGDLLAGPYQIVGDGATIQLQNSKVSHGYIEWWGAKGDSTTDDLQAFVEAIIYMDGREIKLLSGRDYLFQNTQQKNLDGHNIRLTTTGSNRANIVFADTVNAFRISGVPLDTVTIDGALASGTDTLLVDDASNIKEGYLIEVRSDEPWYYDQVNFQPKGELHFVRKVSSDTVWTRHVTFDSYNSSEDVDVLVYKPIVVQIEGVNFIYHLSESQSNGIALEARYWGPGSRITNCSIQEADLTGLQLTSCFNIRVDNSEIIGCDKSGNGYGIHDRGGYGSIIENNYFYGNRSGIDAGNYMSRANKFTNNVVNASSLEDDSKRALGLHELAEGWLIEDNIIESAYYGVVDRGTNNVIKGNKFHSIGAVVISKNGGGSLTVQDNVYNSQLDKREDVGAVSLEAQQANTFVTISTHVDASDTSFFSIKNNVVNGISTQFISIKDSINNLELVNNMVRFNTSGNPVLLLAGSANAPVKNSAIIDNVVFAPNGDYIPFVNADIDESTLVRLFEGSKIAIGNVAALDSTFNVEGGASFSGGIYANGGLGAGTLQSGGILYAGASGEIENSTSLYYNSISRRLGIQVNSPEAALHVAEGTEARLLFGDNGPSSNPQLTIFKNDDSIIGSNLLGYLAWAGKDNTGNTRTTHAQIYVKASSSHDPGDNPTDMYFDVTPDNSSTLTTRMLIQNDGDVGVGSVGSSTPEASLHIFASSESQVLVGNDGPSSNTQLTFYRNDDNIVGDNPLGYLSWAGKDNTGNIRTPHARIYVKASSPHDPGDNPTNMYFEVTPDNSSTLTTALYIDQSGNIGIGTEMPSERLSVTGYVQRNEVDFYDAVHLFQFGTAVKDTVDSREEVLAFEDGDSKIGKIGFPDWFSEVDSVQISISTSSSADKNTAFDLQWVGIGMGESTGQSFSSAISDTISLGSTASVRKVLTFVGEFSNLAVNDAILWKLTRDGSISNNESSSIRVHDIRFFYN